MEKEKDNEKKDEILKSKKSKSASVSPKEKSSTLSDIDLVNIQVNGEWRKVPKGTRVIEAIKDTGTEVPHYCYHEKLSSPGNCRMCMVELGMPPRPKPGEELKKDKDGYLPIHWSPRPMISCANVVAENMGIRTDSKLVTQAREGVMEFLLINHPLDCPICDQAGECSLQEFSVEYGRGESRFEDNKTKKPKNVKIGSRVTLDNERCILCTRCIRFCEEVVDDNVLGIGERGSYNKIITFPGEGLENNYSLNTVDICPVGALTSTDFRFKMRTWFLKQQESICTGCSTGCNINIESRNNTIYRLTPRRNDEVNSNWMCDSGRLTYKKTQFETRLNQPMIKEVYEGGKMKFSQISWSALLSSFNESLTGIPNENILFVISGNATNEEFYLLKKITNVLKLNEFDKNVFIVRESGAGDDYLVSSDRSANINGGKLFFGENIIDVKQLKKVINSDIYKLICVFDFNGNIADEIPEVSGDSNEKSIALFGLIDSSKKNDKFDALLPLASFAENQGTLINKTGRIQKLLPAVNIADDSKIGWKFLNQIFENLSNNFENKQKSFFDIFNEMIENTKKLNSIKWQEIGNCGTNVIETNKKIKLLERERERITKGEING